MSKRKAKPGKAMRRFQGDETKAAEFATPTPGQVELAKAIWRGVTDKWRNLLEAKVKEE